MNTKLCKCCNIKKPLQDFKKENRNSDGRSSKCKLCVNTEQREWRKSNPLLAKDLDRKRRDLPSSKMYMAKYFDKNREKLCSKARDNYNRNKQPYLLRAKQQRESNPEEYKQYQKKWRLENKKYLNEYTLNKLHTDPIFKLKHNLRSRLRKFVKNRSRSALKYLGCDIKFLIGYFEGKFKDGMTWENHGKVWHIDHILPCRSFNLSKESEIQKCFHYTNLQPLFISENLLKSDKLPNGKHARDE